MKDDYWIIRDRVDSVGTHDIKLWLHFDSNVTPERSLQVSTFGRDGEWIRESGWVSHCYGSKEEAPINAFSVHANGSEELITLLIPAASKPIITELEALNGRAFALDFEDKHDVLLLRRERGRIETARFASDFDLAWIRFGNEEARSPEELVLIGGGTVELDGRILLKSTRTIDYLVASSIGDRFRVETGDGEMELSLPIMDLESLFAK